MTRRAVSFVEVKALNDEQRVLEGWATRPETDRVGDIVESRGARFKLPLPLLLDHDHTAAVGEVIHAVVSDAGIRFKAKIAKLTEPGAVKELTDRAWHLASSGLRKAVSIGFRPLDAEPLSDGGWRYRSWEWYELSMVTVPALASASIDQVKAFDRDLRRKSDSGRVVYLDRPSTRVVKLDSPAGLLRPEQHSTVAGAMTKASETFEADLERLEAIQKLGSANALLIDSMTAGAKATDAELATLRERIARLERRN